MSMEGDDIPKKPTSITIQHSTEHFSIIIKETTILGRKTIPRLSKYEDISREHCKIIFSEDGIHVQDLHSSNGTWVNEDKLEEEDQTKKLMPTDKITLGLQPFRVVSIK